MACGRAGFLRFLAWPSAHLQKSDLIELPGSFFSAKKKAGDGMKLREEEQRNARYAPSVV